MLNNIVELKIHYEFELSREKEMNEIQDSYTSIKMQTANGEKDNAPHHAVVVSQ